jgi:hypothetical protein
MLHGGPPQIDNISPSLLDRIGAAVLAEARVEPPGFARKSERIGSLKRWGFSAIAVAALIVSPLALRLWQRSTPEFQARGASHANERSAGLRAFCLDEGAVTPRCARNGLLRLAVNNGGGFRYLFVVGMDDSWAIKWYEPHPPSQSSVAAPASGEPDVPVSTAIRLAVNHDAGRLRIWALFSDRPIDAHEIEAAAAQLERRHLLPSLTGKLPIERADVTQRTLTLEVDP